MALVHMPHRTQPIGLDAPLEPIAAQARQLQKPLRVRLQPDLYDWSRTGYHSWLGLAWLVDVQDAEEAVKLRQGLEDFLTVFAGSVRQQRGVLGELRRRARGGR